MVEVDGNFALHASEQPPALQGQSLATTRGDSVGRPIEAMYAAHLVIRP
jgi:hypothetical protein